MYVYPQEVLDAMVTIQLMLREFLFSIASGTSQEAFLRDSQNVAQLINEINELRATVNSLRVENEDLESRLDLAQDQVSDLRDNHDAEVRSLLERALGLIGRGSDATATATHVDGWATQTALDPTDNVEVLIGLEEEDLDEDFDDLYEAANPDDGYDDDDDDSDDEINDEDFDFDDEDLETRADTVPAGTITKNPEITENFVSLEDSHLTMFIFVRYSHLPYHYTMNGVRYKLLLAGSQIVSTTV